MKATATRNFTASVDGRQFSLEAGETLEADQKTVEKLASAGVVEVKKERKGREPGKAEENER